MPQAYIDFYYDNSSVVTKTYEDTFTITALEDNCNVYYVYNDSYGINKPLYMSLNNGVTWTIINPLELTRSGNDVTTQPIATLQNGESLMLLATPDTQTDEDTFSANQIITSKKSELSGYLWSIVSSTGYKNPTNPNIGELFAGLFTGSYNHICKTSNLILPPFVSEWMYWMLFRNCTDLEDTPVLPATTLAGACYQQMFEGCTSLTTAPELPATTLAVRCYSNMFRNCTSIVYPPVLPATTLTTDCYANMFNGCTSLVSSPTFYATSLAYECYSGMFSGCTSLTSVNDITIETSSDNNATTCCSYMFENCTSLVNPPKLIGQCNAKGDQKFAYMFKGCTSLTKAPDLLKQTNNNQDDRGLYQEMFQGCTSLRYIYISTTSPYDSIYYTDWVKNVAPSGTFVKNINVNFPIDSDSGIPIGWTVVNEGELMYNVSVTIDPTGKGTVTGEGNYYYNEYATLEATPIEGYYFDGWYINNEMIDFESRIIYEVTEDVNITAKFTNTQPTPYYTVNIYSTPYDGGTYSGTGFYHENDNATVSAYPFGDYTFDGWYLDNVLVSSNATYTFQVTRNTVLEARFIIPQYTLTYSVNDGTMGSISCSYPSGSSINLGTEITLQAIANTDYAFKGWYEDNQYLSNELSYTFNIQENTTIQANFVFQTIYDVYKDKYFTVESLEDGNEIYLRKRNNSNPITLDCSFDEGATWETMTVSSTYPITLDTNETLSLRQTGLFNSSYSVQIHTSKTFNAYGNIKSLQYGDNFNVKQEQINNANYYRFFNESKIIDASNLVIEVNQVYSCSYMFYRCTSLTNPPILFNTYGPAEENVIHYPDALSFMFRECLSLTTAPALPATTLTSGCYYGMFYRCTSLTTAPTLPATTLANSCYYGMFSGCTSLTTAPALPATTLTKMCYTNMFYHCESLTTAPALPATTLAYNCYYSMFNGCTALTTAPALPATTLTGYCYSLMFAECESLTTAPALPATTLANSCYESMFYRCTSLTTAPALPATTLADMCYYRMFLSCSSLTTAPALPATTLANNCYYEMFGGCTSLNSITLKYNTLFRDYPTNYTGYWVSRVSDTGTFYMDDPNYNQNVSTYLRGENFIPINWTVQQYVPS